MKNLIFALMLFGAMSLQAQARRTPFDLKLWPNGYTVTNGDEDKAESSNKSAYQPDIKVYLPSAENANGKAVIILPGGGYSNLAVNHEGYDFAPFFNNDGYALIVLRYRMPKGNKDVPFADVEKAYSIVRDSATQWGIDPSKIGIMGSSAGGHLASTYATKCKPELRPAFQVLLYPVISMEIDKTHRGSRDNLLGKNPSENMVELYCNEKQVTENTPQAFIVLSGDDKAVLPVNGVSYYMALNQKGVPASLHVYPTEGHGWGIRDSFKYKLEFLNELRTWLKNI